MNDTDDLVQITLLRAWRVEPEFQSDGEAAFFAYLRRIFDNLVRDARRRAARDPEHGALDELLRTRSRSPLEEAIRSEASEFCNRALSNLPETQRRAVALRFEGGCSFQEIAKALDRPSADAARMLVARGLARCRLWNAGRTLTYNPPGLDREGTCLNAKSARSGRMKPSSTSVRNPVPRLSPARFPHQCRTRG